MSQIRNIIQKTKKLEMGENSIFQTIKESRVLVLIKELKKKMNDDMRLTLRMAICHISFFKVPTALDLAILLPDIYST